MTFEEWRNNYVNTNGLLPTVADAWMAGAAEAYEQWDALLYVQATEIRSLREAIERACASYPADDATTPTCVGILRRALKA